MFFFPSFQTSQLQALSDSIILGRKHAAKPVSWTGMHANRREIERRGQPFIYLWQYLRRNIWTSYKKKNSCTVSLRQTDIIYHSFLILCCGGKPIDIYTRFLPLWCSARSLLQWSSVPVWSASVLLSAEWNACLVRVRSGDWLVRGRTFHFCLLFPSFL